jgi:hypothetical protein
MKAGKLLAAICAGVIASLVMAASASADSVEVTTNLDTPGGADGCTLRDAVDSVETNGSINACNLVAGGTTDDITFADSLSGQTIDLTNGALSIDATPGGLDIEIIGPGMGNLTISADDDARALNLNGGVINITGLTVRDGEVAGDGQMAGGCILSNNDSNVDLIDVRVTNCSVSASGAVGEIADGGGVYADDGSITLDGSVVDLNTATATNTNALGTSQARGAGIHGDTGSFLDIENSAIRSNIATAINDGADITIAAGGVFSDDELELSTSTVNGNTGTATENGSGEADATGAIKLGENGGGTIELSTIAGNIGDPSSSGVTFPAGGINSQAEELEIHSSTIALNGPTSLTGTGGANLIVNGEGGDAAATVGNSIIADPRGDNLNCLVVFGADLISGGFNVTHPANDTPPPDSQCFDDPQDPTDLLADPLLATAGLASNGGPTQTIALQPTSPAIDAGHDEVNEEDQRGFTRPIDFPGITDASGGNGADIGAFEVQQECAGQATPSTSCSPPPGPTPTQPVTPTPGPTPTTPKKKCKKAKKGASSAKKKCKRKKKKSR